MTNLQKTGRFAPVEALKLLRTSVGDGRNLGERQLKKLAGVLGIKLEPGDVAIDETGEILRKVSDMPVEQS